MEGNKVGLEVCFDTFDIFDTVLGMSLKKISSRVVIPKIMSNPSNVSKVKDVYHADYPR